MSPLIVKSGDVVVDAVTRIRQAAAFLLMSDQDATFAMIDQFTGLLLDRLQELLEHLDTIEATVTAQTTSKVSIDLSDAKQMASNLSSATTQIGEATAARVLEEISKAGVAIGGASVEESRSELQTIRARVDVLYIEVIAGSSLLIDLNVGALATSSVTEYMMTSRRDGIVGLMASAEASVSSGRYKQALQYLAEAYAGLNIDYDMSGLPTGTMTKGLVSIAANSDFTTVLVPGTATFPKFSVSSSMLSLMVDDQLVELVVPASDYPQALANFAAPTVEFTVANNELVLIWDPEVGATVQDTLIFAHGVQTLAAVASQIGAAFSFVMSVGSTADLISLTGPAEAGVLYMGECTASTLLPFQVSSVGADLTLGDLNAVWASTHSDRFVLMGGVTDVSLSVLRALEVEVLLDGNGAGFFGFAASTFSGLTTVVTSEGLSVGDMLNGAVQVTHQSVTGSDDYVLSVPLSASLTEVTVSAGGVDAFESLQNALVGLVTIPPEDLRILTGLPFTLWSLWDRQIRASDKSNSIAAIMQLRVVFTSMITALQGYDPPQSTVVESLFQSLSAYGLDLGAWYLGSLQLEEFFTKEVFLLSSAGSLANGVAGLLGSVEALRGKRVWESR